MKEDYAAWIAKYLADTPAYGTCHAAAAKMNEAFPELRIVKGHVFDGHWGKRSHSWCAAPDGEVVDPTASQFPALFEYEEWKPGDEIRVGTCMECGEVLWARVQSLEDPSGRRNFCNESCEVAFTEAVNAGLG